MPVQAPKPTQFVVDGLESEVGRTLPLANPRLMHATLAAWSEKADLHTFTQSKP